MPEPRKTQKQIAQRYARNLRYFRRFHPFRLARRALLYGCLIVSAIAAFIYLHNVNPARRGEWLNSPGAISEAHSGFGRDCKQCHDSVVKLDLFKPAVADASMDAKCAACHIQHTFHQANVVIDHSCTECHHEHVGSGPMQPVTDNNCQSCHGNAAVMQASAQKGMHLPANVFLVPAKDNLVYFEPPRPADGYTKVFQSFEGDHPDFQIQREHLTDINTLKFSHKTHLFGAIPMVDGHKLDCNYCHKPDSQGAYMQSISFAKNCQACHALQIDPSLPDFQIPHPEAENQVDSVRNFLLTLPTQYATYAAEKGMTDQGQINSFVNQHMLAVRQRIREGSDLVNEVFYADDRSVHLNMATPTADTERALFPGCAYCHEVKSSPLGDPVVTKPATPDRWYVHARFDHAAHTTMNCNACHGQVLVSNGTSDIALPDKASCVTCHSAKGGVVSTCTTCHNYHNPDPAHTVASSSTLKNMMLGNP